MFKLHVDPAVPRPEVAEDEHSLAADLAWEYCQRVRNAENPSKDEYFERLKDDENRTEFDFLVNTNEFIELFVDDQVMG